MITTGLETLLRERVGELAGKRIGVLANQASVTSGLVHIADALVDGGVNVRALFGPEHGTRGDSAAGAHVMDAYDHRLGVPVHSLYGRSRFPTPESLREIDVILVDLQDVGARFYTYIYTMANAMVACGTSGVPVWVLDRPNPITGLDPEGPVLDPESASFVGMYPIPIRHAMTIGELAELFVNEFQVECDLTVIPMQGWSRDMWFDQTGLPWVMPSPNMPTLDTAIVYPGTCLLEGTNVSAGRGTTRPFEIVGAPWVDPYDLKSALVEYALPGAVFRECWFVPSDAKFKGERCAGVQIHVTNRDAFRPVATGIAILCALRGLYPDSFEFLEPEGGGRCHFDLLAGSSVIREQIEAGMSPTLLVRGSNLTCGALDDDSS